MKRLFVVIAVMVAVFVAATPPTGLSDGQKPAETKPLKPVKVGFIGDSITVGAAGDYNAVQNEMDQLGNKYSPVNRGVGGTTSEDWLPHKALYKNSFTIFKSEGVRVVSIMLGTNDANRMRVKPQKYYENMRTIISELIVSGQIKYVIVNYPPYSIKADKLPLYIKQLDKLINNNTTIIKGDTSAYDYFKEHQVLLSDGVHPTNEGYKELGIRWASAFKRFLETHHPQDI